MFAMKRGNIIVRSVSVVIGCGSLVQLSLCRCDCVIVCEGSCAIVCVRVRVSACLRACVRARVCVCVCVC